MLLVDCHSMPASATAHVAPPGAGMIDVVLGDRFGASCAEDISAFVEERLERHGLRVLRNKPYAGGFITQNHGAPHRGQHALQIEINRGLYMNEASWKKPRTSTAVRRGARRCGQIPSALSRGAFPASPARRRIGMGSAPAERDEKSAPAASFVYVIGAATAKGYRTYVGWTLDPARRLDQHNAGTGAKSTRGMAWRILYVEKLETRTAAMSREWHLKRDRRFRKLLAQQ